MTNEQAMQALKKHGGGDGAAPMWFWASSQRREGYEQDEDLFQTLYRLAEAGEIGKHVSSIGEWDEKIHFSVCREALR